MDLALRETSGYAAVLKAGNRDAWALGFDLLLSPCVVTYAEPKSDSHLYLVLEVNLRLVRHDSAPSEDTECGTCQVPEEPHCVIWEV